MFDNPRYITKGVCESIPLFLQNLIWKMIDEMPAERDYLQVFTLSERKGRQRVIHEQECPAYNKVYTLNLGFAVCGKIFVIDDETHSTMLLASEY